jgi:hypothetical protein
MQQLLAEFLHHPMRLGVVARGRRSVLDQLLRFGVHKLTLKSCSILRQLCHGGAQQGEVLTFALVTTASSVLHVPNVRVGRPLIACAARGMVGLRG